MMYIAYNQCDKFIKINSLLLNRLHKSGQRKEQSENNDFFVHFISLYINSFPRQNKVFGGLEIVSAFGRAPKFAHCDEMWGVAKNCTLFWLRFVLGSCVQKYQLGYI